MICFDDKKVKWKLLGGVSVSLFWHLEQWQSIKMKN